MPEPTQRSSFFALLLTLTGLFGAGVAIALFAWPYLTLPYKNPYHILSFLTDIQYNPDNNTLRFAFTLICPVLLLILAYALNVLRLSDRMRAFSERLLVSLSRRSLGARHYFFWTILSMLISLSMPTYLAWGPFDSYHEGESLGVAVSQDHGQKPYKDFTIIHGVFQDPGRSSLAFSIFGRSIASVRSLESMLKVVCWALLGLYCLVLMNGNLLLAAALMSALSVLSWKGGMTLMQRESLLFVYSVCLLIVHRQVPRLDQDKRTRFIVLSMVSVCAFLGTASFAYSIDRGVYLFVLSMVFLPVIVWRSAANQRLTMTVCIIIFALLGFVVFGMALQWTYSDFIEFCFVQMPKYKDLLDGFVYPISVPRFFLFFILCSLLVYVLSLQFLSLRTLCVSVQSTAKLFLDERMVHVFVVLVALLLYRNVLGRPDVTHMEYSIHALLTACAFFFAPALQSVIGYFSPKQEQWSSFAIMGMLAIASCVATNRQHDINYMNFPLGVADEHFIPKEHQAATDYMRERIQPSENFVTLTSEASWYYYLDKPCPLRFSMITVAMPDFFCDEVIHDWKKKNIRFILYRNDHWANWFEGHVFDESMPRLDSFIKQNYQAVANIQGQQIWEWRK